MGAKIPQDVTREDKLIGPLTLRQFLYLLGGGGIVFIVYQSYASQYLYFAEFLAIAMVIGILAFGLAFGMVNGRPFGVFLINLFRFFTNTKNLLWRKELRTKVAAIKAIGSDIKTTKDEAQDRKSGKQLKTQIEQLANILDTGGTIESDKAAMSAPITAIVAPLTHTEPPDVEDVLKDVD